MRNAPSSEDGGGALAGLKVVEMGQLIAGPFCGQLLGDQGADVVKIEPPDTGDPMRLWGQGDAPSWWQVIGRNKRSVAIDLRTPEGQALARSLIDRADILIENFRPGTLEKWGLDPQELQRTNPGLIVVRVSGYGQNGPYSERAGFGGIGEAMGGWRGIVGYPDRPPVRVGVSIGDSLAATFGCLGALAALHYRSKTGKGQIIDAALYESVLQVMESLVSDYSVSGHVRQRHGPTLPGIAPSNVYRCTDGEILIGANQDTVFRRLCAAMKRDDLSVDDRFRDHVARGRNQAELDTIIDDWTRLRSVSEVEDLMSEYGIPAGRIFGPGDMMEDPHFKARQAIVSVDHPDLNNLAMQNVFPKFSLTPGRIRKLAPLRPGQDIREVLREWLDQEWSEDQTTNIQTKEGN